MALTNATIQPKAAWFAGTIGHVAHGKSTVVKAISGVQTVRFKNELERNITIKLGYANAKIFKAADAQCPRLPHHTILLCTPCASATAAFDFCACAICVGVDDCCPVIIYNDCCLIPDVYERAVVSLTHPLRR